MGIGATKAKGAHLGKIKTMSQKAYLIGKSHI
jgi:hypothetical protein